MVRTGLEGVEFIVANTDLQALAQNAAPTRIQIGGKLTKGLGAGADPDIGRRAALEDTDKLIEVLSDADMVFVTTGLGGGTGTGAAPVIAGLASELGALTIAVVTKPFKFEGKRRAAQADRGLDELRDAVDTVITIPNERLLATIDRRTPLPEAFAAADDVLRQAIQGISDLILVPGMINLDFADVKTIMSGMGFAIMGTGNGEGETRAIDAAQRAISSPLLEDASVKGARGVIINITGGPDFSLAEVNDAAMIIQEAAHEDANIIFGAVIDPEMHGTVKITVIATGFDRPDASGRAGQPDAGRPAALHRVAAGGPAGRGRWRRRPHLDLAAADDGAADCFGAALSGQGLSGQGSQSSGGRDAAGLSADSGWAWTQRRRSTCRRSSGARTADPVAERRRIRYGRGPRSARTRVVHCIDLTGPARAGV